MVRLPRPEMTRMSVIPAPTASSTTYWMAGLSTTGSISFGWDFVAGRNRVPRPAAGITAFLTFMGLLGGEEPEVYRSGPRPTLRGRRGSLASAPYNRCHAYVRVRLPVVWDARGGLSEVQRRTSHGMRSVRGAAPEGVPPGRHPVQGIRLLRHGLAGLTGQGRRGRRRPEGRGWIKGELEGGELTRLRQLRDERARLEDVI